MGSADDITGVRASICMLASEIYWHRSLGCSDGTCENTATADIQAPHEKRYYNSSPIEVATSHLWKQNSRKVYGLITEHSHKHCSPLRQTVDCDKDMC